VCVPDGPAFWGNYLKIYEEELAKQKKDRNPQRLRDHVDLFFNDICTRRSYLGSMGHTHKWNFDEVQLADMLESNGFSMVRRMKFHDSRIPNVDAVEPSDFLILEGVKA